MGVRLGEALRQERRRRQLRQSDVADTFNIKQPSYARWETGENDPDIDRLQLVADFLSLEIGDVWELINADARATAANDSEERGLIDAVRAILEQYPPATLDELDLSFLRGSGNDDGELYVDSLVDAFSSRDAEEVACDEIAMLLGPVEPARAINALTALAATWRAAAGVISPATTAAYRLRLAADELDSWVRRSDFDVKAVAERIDRDAAREELQELAAEWRARGSTEEFLASQRLRILHAQARISV